MRCRVRCNDTENETCGVTMTVADVVEQLECFQVGADECVLLREGECIPFELTDAIGRWLCTDRGCRQYDPMYADVVATNEWKVVQERLGHLEFADKFPEWVERLDRMKEMNQ